MAVGGVARGGLVPDGPTAPRMASMAPFRPCKLRPTGVVHFMYVPLFRPWFYQADVVFTRIAFTFRNLLLFHFILGFSNFASFSFALLFYFCLTSFSTPLPSLLFPLFCPILLFSDRILVSQPSVFIITVVIRLARSLRIQ